MNDLHTLASELGINDPVSALLRHAEHDALIRISEQMGCAQFWSYPHANRVGPLEARLQGLRPARIAEAIAELRRVREAAQWVEQHQRSLTIEMGMSHACAPLLRGLWAQARAQADEAVAMLLVADTLMDAEKEMSRAFMAHLEALTIAEGALAAMESGDLVGAVRRIGQACRLEMQEHNDALYFGPVRDALCAVAAVRQRMGA